MEKRGRKKMESKDNKIIEQVNKPQEEASWEWVIGLILVGGLFSDNGVWGSKKATDTDLRIAKLEAKVDLLEKLTIK